MHDRLVANGKALDDNRNLSADGKANSKRTSAEGNRASFLQVRGALAQAQANQQMETDALIPRAVDPTNAAGAPVRSDYRARISKIPSPRNITLGASIKDPQFIAAIYEGAPILSELTAEQRNELSQIWLRANRSVELRAIENNGEAINVKPS